MMNVIIVDDEPIIRMGLRTLIDWEQHGFSLVGEASDGEEALALLDEQRVDLLVTDIRMPRMDGLELIRQANVKGHDLGVVVLSCLDDFSFVKEAMKLGARDYILKPTMEPDELVGILQAIGARLNEERQERARIEELNLRVEQSKPYRLQAKVIAYLEHGVADGDLEKELFKGGKKIYSMLVHSPPHASFQLRDPELQDIAVAVRMQDNQQLLLLECDRGISANAWYQLAHSAAEKLLRSVRDSLEDMEPASYPILYVGPPLQEIGELPKRVEYHRSQLLSRFYGKSKDPIFMDEPSSASLPSEQQLPAAARNNLLRAIAGGNPEAIWHSMQEMLTMIEQIRPDMTRLYAFLFETAGLAVGYARDNGYSGISELEQQYLSMDAMMGWNRFEELAEWLRRFVRELSESRDGFRMKRDIQHPFVRKAIAYIRENYANNIGTADIAEHVKLSRSYLSDLYGKEVGESLTETLTRVRIEEACKLLASTDKKIYEIAEEIGFNDSKTFTKTFKRLMGCSPKEYPVSNK